jgi:hypothetical protein
VLEVFEEAGQNSKGVLLHVIKGAIVPDVLEGGLAVSVGSEDSPPYFGGVTFEEDD